MHDGQQRFEVVLLEPAVEFMDSIDLKARTKIYYILKKSSAGNDPRLFKKLTGSIWEFRIRYNGIQYRLFAFWDKTSVGDIKLVLATHGIVKKTSSIPAREVRKANLIMNKYYDEKRDKN